jgi:hypothetical protein
MILTAVLFAAAGFCLYMWYRKAVTINAGTPKRLRRAMSPNIAFEKSRDR